MGHISSTLNSNPFTDPPLPHLSPSPSQAAAGALVLLALGTCRQINGGKLANCCSEEGEAQLRVYVAASNKWTAEMPQLISTLSR
jgi:hypothetical protein